MITMMRRFAHEIWTQTWLLGVVLLVLLALYTSLGRQLIPLIESYEEDIEQQLSQGLDMPVEIQSLQGYWRWFSPSVRVINTRIGEGESVLQIDNIEAELDVAQSVLLRSIVFKNIVLRGVELPFYQTPEKQWQLADFLLQVDDAINDKPLWLELLSQQQEVLLYDWRLSFTPHQQSPKYLKLKTARLRNRGDQHWLEARLASTA